MKKVLHIFRSINYSGAEIMYEGASNLFIENGFVLHALSTGDLIGDFVARFERAGYLIMSLPNERKRNFIYYLSIPRHFILFYKLLKKENYDIVHIHREDMDWFYAFVCKLAKIPRIIRTVHSVFTPKNQYKLYRMIFTRRLSRIIFKVKYTSISEDVYKNELQILKNKTALIKNWYNSLKYFPVNYKNKNILRDKLEIPIDSNIITTVGSCQKLKNHKDVILAIEKLSKIYDKILYLHLGDGETNKEERELSQKLGINRFIRYLGNVNNVDEYLRASDIFLMPSDYEGISIAGIEAMACEIPCVFYNSPGLRNLMEDKKFKPFLIEPGHKNIVDAIMNIIEEKSYNQEIKNIAKKNIEYNYNMNENVKKIIKLYNEK